MKPTQTSRSGSEQHLKRAIQDQLEVIAAHMSGDCPLCAQFVRDHALIVLQLSEALKESVERTSTQAAS